MAFPWQSMCRKAEKHDSNMSIPFLLKFVFAWADPISTVNGHFSELILPF